MNWQDLCHQKRAEREARIPEEWKIKDASALAHDTNLLDIPNTSGILTSREIEITTTNDAVDLLQKLADGTYTAFEVTSAFCKRAAIAQSLVNCLTEICFEEAMERARELDAERTAHPERPLRPFHGLPISLKDSFKIAGYDATIGMSCFIKKPAEVESALVTYLRSLGAIIYCKTNVPQTMMTADSDNNIFGRTRNPNNTKLTAGGSTGGEGALIALRGSIFGIGTDIAGSVRIPAHCNGIYACKPSASIIPYGGQQSAVAPGWPGIVPSAGPLATSARACQFFMQVLMSGEVLKFDNTCVNVRWLSLPPPSRSLRIGIIGNDGVYTPNAPMRRALRESVTKLSDAGMECMHVQIEGVSQIMDDIWDLFSLDGAKATCDLIASSGEPLMPSVEAVGLVERRPKTIDQLVRLNVRQAGARSAVHKLWQENDLDCILTVPAPYPAPPLDAWCSITYTSIYNYLDLPCFIIPVGRVSESDVMDHKADLSEMDAKVYELCTYAPSFFFIERLLT